MGGLARPIHSHGFRVRTEPLRETVYRYRAVNEWLEQILKQDELYFCTPDGCNDSFDCRFCVCSIKIVI